MCVESIISPVFQDRIYWTDRDRAAVFMANRLSGQDVHTLAENLNDPHDLVVFHQLRQPPGVCTVWARECVCVCVCVCVCARLIVSVHFAPLAVIVLVTSLKPRILQAHE